MNYKNIIFNVIENTAIIHLNRPEVLNSFNYQMADEFLNALEECKKSSIIRAIFISGEGRAFCAGQDLEEATKKNGPPIDAIIEHTYNPIIKAITNINKPVVCCVNGVAAGAGANLAIGCDITFATKSSKFIQSFVNIALVPDTGGSYFLPRLIGKQKAAGLMFSGDKISAEEAEKIGMIYQCVEDNNAYETAFNFATRLSKMPTKSIGLIKDLLRKTYSNNLEQQLELEKEHQIIAANSKDNEEGITAFFEKRKPNYKGE
jgi:2-(1,2-epoxy-1,2-dihydrophenyl)acetyl-CoA isomerase